MPQDPHCLSLLARRLAAHGPLSNEDHAAIFALPCDVRTLDAARYIVREGEPPSICAVLISGFAYRQKLTSDGVRQIVSLLIPGEPLDFQSLFLSVADHSIQALTEAEIGFIPRPQMHALLVARPAVARAVLINSLVEASIGREWLLNVGRRDARARLAHFLCEFAVRMDAQGLGNSGGYEVPMTQEQLGDVLGLTAVHVNRTLRALEGDGLLKRDGRRIIFTRWADLRAEADFSARYLHLDQTAPAGAAQPG